LFLCIVKVLHQIWDIIVIIVVSALFQGTTFTFLLERLGKLTERLKGILTELV
jgi:hypothetical protein